MGRNPCKPRDAPGRSRTMPVNLSKAWSTTVGATWNERRGSTRRPWSRIPDEPEALHLLGVVALQRGDALRAIDLIGRAISLRPNVAIFHANLGEAYWMLGQADQLIACCQAALRLEPESPGVLCNLGSTLVVLGDLDAGDRASSASDPPGPGFLGGPQ